MECPICYKNNYLISLPCTHHVCFNCLGQVLEEETSKCPMCRYQLLDIDNLMTKLNENDANTQCYFGYLYENGVHGQITIHVDFKKSFKWYLKSAKQDNAYAQCSLGDCYQLGKGVKMNIIKAKKWFKKSAKQNNATAQYQLGVIYLMPRFTNFAKARKYLKRASKQEYSPADVHLGMMYLNGKGFEQDEKKAIEYLKSAMENECYDAHYYLGTIYEKQGKIKEAIELYQTSAQAGYPRALTRMGVLHFYGIGVDLDTCKASFFFNEARDVDPEAAFCFGYYCETVKKNDEMAMENYDIAIQDDYIPAHYNLAILFEKMGDLELAEDEYYYACSDNDSDAQCNLGNLLLRQGKTKTAIEFYKDSAKQNNMYAQYNLGLLYELGEGVKQDSSKAVFHYRRSAEQGMKEAIYKMGEIYLKGDLTKQNVVTANGWFQKLL